jgi:soluble lytic murein transglycosylase-like protein/tetratricopeptide (TPR) repeat protein
MKPSGPLPLLAFALILPCLAGADPLRGPLLPDVAEVPGLPPIEALPGADLEVAIDAWSRGDLPDARRELEAVLARRRVDGATRVRAYFLLGWVSARLGNHQQASGNFWRVRKLDEHPLKEAASFYEAKADLDRGHPRTAIAECGTYRDTWKEGRWYDECLLVEADAHVAIGSHTTAIELYEDFLDEHPDDQRQETIHLRIARSLEETGSHEEAARRYRALYISHRLPMTARQATAGLERMRSAGVQVAEVTDEQLYMRACSLRDAGQYDESWGLYCELLEKVADEGEAANPALARQLDSKRHDFLWRNRRFEELARSNVRLYERAPEDPGAVERLYWAVEGFSRSGLYDEAVKYQEIGLQRFPQSHRFRREWEKTTKLYAGAGQYSKAREGLAEWMRNRSSARNNRTRFYMAFYAYRAGQLETAVEEFTTLVEGRSKYKTAARFFRGKALERQEEWRAARDDHRAVIKDDPDSWYAVVLRSRARRRSASAEELALARTGRWPGTPLARSTLPGALPATTLSGAVVRGWDRPRQGRPDPLEPSGQLARDVHGRAQHRRFDGWSSASLIGLRPATAPPEPPEPAPAIARDRAAPAPSEVAALTIPATWAESEYWNPEEGRELWEEFAEDHEELWPELPAAYELSRCGLGEIAGPILGQIYEEVRDVRRSRRIRSRVSRWRSSGGSQGGAQAARWAAIMDIDLDAEDWRSIFASAGYPASVSAFALDSINFRRHDRSTPEGRDVWTLRFPAAYAPHVWRVGFENDVDPLLLLSVMRAESLYRHDAVSRAGAMGLIQVMPTTGNKVAALMGDEDFRVDRLLEPEVNIRLGAFYLGQLMDRFGDGQFPLAVGSYNGGPHNVGGRWLRQKVDVPFEDFVEEIQFVETRTYIKRVIEYYSIYSEIYTEGGWVMLPTRTVEDDPSVINF